MLRMSLYAHPHLRNSGSLFGYAYAFNETQKALREYVYKGEKIQVDLNSPKSKIQMYYGSPEGMFYPHQYKIQMVQWESTICPPWWVPLQYDEWWTANQFGAQAMINGGIPEEKVFVYEHGIDSEIWTPHLRGQNDKIRFLTIDAGSPRKRSDLVTKAFIECFEGKPEYELTLKYSGTRTHDFLETNRAMCKSSWAKTNIHHITDMLSLEDLVKMHHAHDVIVYPSEGEGFGLIPMQGLATGMPVISTAKWCSYSKYLGDNIIESKLGVSPVVENYNRYGEVELAEYESIVYQMKKVADDIESQAKFFYNQRQAVVEEYSWANKTKVAFDALLERKGLDMFTTYKGYLN